MENSNATLLEAGSSLVPVVMQNQQRRISRLSPKLMALISRVQAQSIFIVFGETKNSRRLGGKTLIFQFK